MVIAVAEALVSESGGRRSELQAAAFDEGVSVVRVR